MGELRNPDEPERRRRKARSPAARAHAHRELALQAPPARLRRRRLSPLHPRPHRLDHLQADGTDPGHPRPTLVRSAQHPRASPLARSRRYLRRGPRPGQPRPRRHAHPRSAPQRRHAARRLHAPRSHENLRRLLLGGPRLGSRARVRGAHRGLRRRPFRLRAHESPHPCPRPFGGRLQRGAAASGPRRRGPCGSQPPRPHAVGVASPWFARRRPIPAGGPLRLFGRDLQRRRAA